MSPMAFIVYVLSVTFLLVTVTLASDGYGESHSQKIFRMAYEVDTNPKLRAEWARRFMVNNATLPDVRFTCNVEPSVEKPTSVHRLRPSDINVIGAFGDSITAGNGLGAETAPQVAVENRGESFSVGGDYTLEQGVITLTNILRQFNPEIKGFSYCPSTRDNVERSWLNVAEPGGDNRDMPEQALFLIERIKNDTVIDIWADWKVLTMFIGGNDLCASCDEWDKYSPEAYGAKIREAVDILYNGLPRVFLNLVPMFDITPLQNFSANEFCDAMQTHFCDCAVNETTRQQLRTTQLAYYDELKAIADDTAYTYREDFAVVLQPHLRDFEIPIDPETGDYLQDFVAPDCFHPSRLGHQSFAFNLWNTMLIPYKDKPTSSRVNMGPEPNILSCPTTIYPYIFTQRNSP